MSRFLENRLPLKGWGMLLSLAFALLVGLTLVVFAHRRLRALCKTISAALLILRREQNAHEQLPPSYLGQ